MKILLIEDEIGLSEALCQTFRNEKYLATAKYDGQSGLDEALTGLYDVIILDVMLPKMDGFTLLRMLRQKGLGTPVLMLTAKSELEDKVTGLDSGADYYLTKPFAVPELLACIRAIARRREDKVEEDNPSFGDLTLLFRQGGVMSSITGEFIKMSAKELHLLEILIRNGVNIVPKEKLIECIWGLESDAEYNNIEVYVSFVRKKLQFIGSQVGIKSTRGMGYSLEERSK